jgi:crotonobetainyl-CoA:carnitine CoA-transferase CaiB-like acyl-CoA transferase
MSGPLTGIRVLDASNFVFGPVTTQLLGDMGADVIKIEPPEGDPTRRIGAARGPLMGSFFLNLNRNKRSVVLDLKRQDGLDAFRHLLGTADVLVHNMRHQAAVKLRIDYASLAADFPSLVYACAQGYGKGGRYFDRPAYDDVIQGLSGISGLNARMTGAASYIPMLMTDKLCGVFLAYAVAAALLHRERSGRGQEVQVPMFESMAAFNLYDHMADGVLAPDAPAQAPHPLGYARVFGRFHRPLATRDGFICVIANTDAQWSRFLVLLERSDLIADPRFASIGSRMANIDALYETVETELRKRDTATWFALLEQADIPAAPSNDLQALRDDPHLADTGFFVEFDHESEGPLQLAGVPIAMSDSPGGIRLGPPRLGQHTQAVLREAGYDDARIARLG